MFWHLLLAHFIGDYPLQSDWMVAHRKQISVRLLHGAIHFGLMAVLAAPIFTRAWPYLLLLTVIHLAIDMGKTWFTKRLPRWNVGLYIIDQGVHFLVIGLIAVWIGRNVAVSRLLLSNAVVLYALGFLLVTYVWIITERIVLGRRPFSDELSAQAWPRALVRIGLLAVLLIGWNALAPAALGTAIHMPYTGTRSGARALLIDLLVTLVAAGFVIAANR